MRGLDRYLGGLRRRILLMVGRAVLTAVDDAGGLQRVAVTALKDETHDAVERFQNYGFTSHPLAGADVLLVAVAGNRDHPIAAAIDDRRRRPHNSRPGDVALYHESDDPEADAASARHRLTLTLEGGKRTLRIRCEKLVIEAGGSSLVLDEAGFRVVAPRVDLN